MIELKWIVYYLICIICFCLFNILGKKQTKNHAPIITLVYRYSVYQSFTAWTKYWRTFSHTVPTILLKTSGIHIFGLCVSSIIKSNSLLLLSEVLDGLKIYFDFTLKDHLLYAEEKAQYELVISSHDCHVTNSMDINGESQYSQTVPSAVYGYIHLLRLFG